jgi:putative transposase
VFNVPDGTEPRQRIGAVLERLGPQAPKVCELLEAAEEDLLAFFAFPAAHWSKLRSTNPLERVNTARSAAAAMWSGSSPTTRRRSAWSARS